MSPRAPLAEPLRPGPHAPRSAPPGRFAFRGLLRRGAATLALAGALLAGACAADAGPCPAGRTDARATVSAVVDGDTLRLADGRALRLVGIDTPEIGRDGAPDEPLAAAARARLQALAGPGERVRLRYDRERRDSHGRALAHVFTPDGRNVQAALLAAGLATTLVVPPNVWGQACYAEAERAARAEGRGLWGRPELAPVEAAALAPSARGLRVVRGEVTRIGRSRHNLWLNLGRDFAVRIPRDQLHHFDPGFPHGLEGRRLEVRGDVYRRNGQLRVTVRHPAALTVD